MRILPLLILLLSAGCATPSEELLPIPTPVRGANHVEAVEVTVRATAAGAVAALDEKAQEREASAAEAARLPFRQMLAATVREVTREWGLTSGRAVKLMVEIDEVATPSTAAVMFGRNDRLAGSVFVTDAATGEPLGQLYVDVRNSNPGLVGIALRGGGVREALAEEFALHIARALSGRRHKDYARQSSITRAGSGQAGITSMGSPAAATVKRPRLNAMVSRNGSEAATVAIR